MDVKPFRVLLTGSRTWKDPALITDTLDDWHALHGPALVIVHGACNSGADAIADHWCRDSHVTAERHPADWTIGRHAGFLRNAAMVDSKPQVCIAFIDQHSPGATHCASLAKKAGIPTLVYRR